RQSQNGAPHILGDLQNLLFRGSGWCCCLRCLLGPRKTEERTRGHACHCQKQEDSVHSDLLREWHGITIGHGSRTLSGPANKAADAQVGSRNNPKPLLYLSLVCLPG